MMKCCCLIVIIFCTIDVSNGGTLSEICLARNGTCGKKGVSCKETFGSEWTYNGKCCHKRPCCKSTCVPANCPSGYMMLNDENAGTNCYLFSGYNTNKSWDEAMRSCAMTPGAFLWHPNNETEANAVRSERIGLWSGGRRDSDGKFTFEIDNLGFVFDQQNIPFGAMRSINRNPECLGIGDNAQLPDITWIWVGLPCTRKLQYICEFPRICP